MVNGITSLGCCRATCRVISFRVAFHALVLHLVELPVGAIGTGLLGCATEAAKRTLMPSCAQLIMCAHPANAGVKSRALANPYAFFAVAPPVLAQLYRVSVANCEVLDIDHVGRIAKGVRCRAVVAGCGSLVERVLLAAR